ncbi:uncharacterized protein VTP21DRAFT_1423 [Calcarisporiella thermophila]|uniref:uncharacterized protein n=1 Tax=Calcarisporiella thermophila TaxID=911321 RepID=UPI003742283F
MAGITYNSKTDTRCSSTNSFITYQESRKFLQFIWVAKSVSSKFFRWDYLLSQDIHQGATPSPHGVSEGKDRSGVLSSMEESRMHSQTLINILEQFGFVINFEKSILTPSQEIEHLGIKIQNGEMTLELLRKKVRDISRVALGFSWTGVTTSRQLAAFLEATYAACPAVMLGKLFARSLMILPNSEHKGRQYNTVFYYCYRSRPRQESLQ